MSRRMLAAVAAAVTALGLVALPSAAATPAPAPTSVAAAAQTLTWTGDNSTTRYASAPTTAVAGETTIVFINNESTLNTTGMPHTLTFDTSTPGYNHDVSLNILASPYDPNGGRHEATVTLTPGKYRYYCQIPGHSTMSGEFTVTGGPGDTTAPTVTANVTGTQDPSGNYVGSATVTLNATDAGSGVDSVEYQLDGGAWQTYTTPVAVSTVGEHMLHYRATDVAGNTSEEGMTSFTVVAGQEEDTTPPTVAATVAGTQDPSGNYVGSATVTVTATDEGSGVASTEYQINDLGWNPYTAPVEITQPGQYTILSRATDAAGNVGEHTVSFTVVEPTEEDTEAPTVTAEVTGTQDGEGNYVDAATVTLSATDAGSGVASVEYQLDGGAWTAYTAPVVINTPGEHMLHHRATDVAGNTSDEGMVMLTVVEQDTEAPAVTAQVVGQQDENGAYVGSAMVTVSAEDAGSGVSSVEYQLDGGAWTAYTAAVQVSTEGEHTLAYRATDVAGNVSETGSVSFTVVRPTEEDTTPPSVSIALTGSQNGNWEYVDTATVTVSALDTGSGVGSVEYKLDDGAWTAYTAPVAVTEAGAHTVHYRATDVAGNTSAELSGRFTVVEGGPGPAPDVCPDSDTRATVVIGGIDSQVANVDIGNGCTINDVIDADGQYGSHTQFVRHVKTVTRELVENGVLSRAHRDRIVTAAVNSTVGVQSASRA